MPPLTLPSVGSRFLTATMLLLLFGQSVVAEGEEDWFDVWHNADKWYEAGHAMLNPDQNRLLVGKPGTGVLLNGKTGRANSLVTKQTYQDVEVHVEFVVAKGSNSGVIFHGNYEIQILDSAHIEAPTGAHCGGVYPRAEGEPGKPSYRHIDAGSPPRVNAARPPGQWQSMDIIFQAPRFDEAGNKTANAKFVRVIHNGVVIQENHEMPHAHGPNWDRQQFPNGRVVLQGDYGPIAFRNVKVRDWSGDTGDTGDADRPLNVPPAGFTSLFNGRDFTGWKMSPRAKQMWSIEDGVLKSHGLLEEWGADLVTEREFQDFVLLADFRMPADSDSGILFGRLLPDMGFFGNQEQMNLGTGHRMGQLESLSFLRANPKKGVPSVTPKDLPRVNRVDPEIGDWHTVKITMSGRTISAELDGKMMIDRFEFPQWLLGTGPAPIRFQKHKFLENEKTGKKNPCPIEFRNLFIKEIGSTPKVTERRKLNVPPEGFTALFNGRDFTGWHTPPLVKQYWSIEDGVLKSPALLERWGADLATKKHYRDFVLMLDFRMPTISDSGINFRRLIPEIPGFGNQEQFNLRSKGGMGHLESYYFLPKETAKRMGLKEEEKPHVRHIDPEVGVWHTVKLTVKGRTLSAEFDGEVLHDNFVYHDWMLNMEPAPIRLQKHIVTYGNTDMGRNLGEVNPCPIEYRNIFIKELGPGEVIASPKPSGKPRESSLEELLARIDKNDLPEAYQPASHQDYVDRRIAKLSNQQMARLGKLWKEKQRLDPDMPNRGNSFVRILEYVAEGKSPPPATKVQKPKPGKKAPDQPGANKSRKPGNQWKWTAESDAKGEQRKTTPIKIPDGRTIHVAGFEVSGDDKPPVVLLPESRLSVSGRLATKCPVHFGITINHPNGDFAGRYQTVRPADEFRGGEDFEVTLELQDFQLDPSLADRKGKLPSQPFHFVVETIWLHTLEKQAGLEVIELELVSVSATQRPNIVVLLADDLGWKDIGCYGGPVKTPTLDRLAAGGVRFTDFYAGAAVCGPSRAVLLTGRHHARTGIYSNVIFESSQKPHLLEREVTLPEVLQRHGYATAHFGKWHLGMPTHEVKKPTPAEHGFDYWFGMNSGANPSHKDPVNFLRNGKPVGKIEGYSCQIIVDEAISWLDEKRDSGEPFLLNLWFHEPHDPIAAPESIVSQYGDLNDQAAIYSGTIDNTDRAIARLLDKLREVDSLENTLVFYTSDNGSYRDDRNGNLRGRKASNFEGGIRVPGIFYWPGTIKEGHVEHEPAGAVDLLPTICGLLGIDKPEGVHLDGSDISPLLTGPSNEFARHQPLYWHLPPGNPSIAIRDGNYSMVAYRDYEFPRDRAAIARVEKEIEEVLRKANSTELVPWVERTDYFYKVFKNKDAERLRSEFIRLNVFQESWIPILKSGSYKHFQSFDLTADPSQKVDVSKQHPEVFSRLKRQLLEINASVMAEAPDWGSVGGTPTPSSPNPGTSKNPESTKVREK